MRLNRSRSIGDADILIAATAIVHGYGVITNNERHFSRIKGLHIDNWLMKCSHAQYLGIFPTRGNYQQFVSSQCQVCAVGKVLFQTVALQ